MANHNLLENKGSSELLSEEDFIFYFKKMKAGDKEAKEIIVSRNLGLIKSRVSAKLKLLSDYEELLACGFVGFMKALNSYNLNYKIKFSTYAVICIDRTILAFLTKEMKNNKNLSFDNIINEENGNNLTIGDMIPDHTINLMEELEIQERKQVINTIIKQLPSREQQVVTEYFGIGTNIPKTQAELGLQLGVSRSRIGAIINKALRTMKPQLESSLELKPTAKKIHKQQWDKHYEYAKCYYEYHGNLKVPQSFRTNNGYESNPNGIIQLGNWLNNQKQNYRKGILSKPRIELLEAIGIIWNIKRNQQVILEICSKYGIDFLKNETILNHISIQEFRSKINYLQSLKQPLIDNQGRLIAIFSMSCLDIEAQYGIDLLTLYATYNDDVKVIKKRRY